MKFSILQNTDLRPLEKLLLDENGLLVPAPFNDINKFSQNDISAFCVKHAIYQLPTIELIEFLKPYTKKYKTIEIGAGNGSIGRALNIPITDNKLQERTDIKLQYLALGQPTINYPKDIIKAGGNHAIKTLKPECVIAAWVTDIYTNNNYPFINESEIVKSVKCYIHIGNEKTHGQKRVLSMFNYKSIKAPWLISRSMSRQENIIYIFEND